MPRKPRAPKPREGLIQHTIDGHTFMLTRACERLLRSKPPMMDAEQMQRARDRRARYGVPDAVVPTKRLEAWMALHHRLFGKAPAGMFDNEDEEEENDAQS